MISLLTFIAAFITLYCVYQLASLAGLFSERSGVANIAIEGNMIIGAVLFAIIYENLGMDAQWLGVVIALSITIPLAALYMMLLAVLTNRYLADHIVAGTGMNLLAPALMIMLYLLLSPNANGGLKPDNISIIFNGWNVEANGVATDLSYIYFIFLLFTIIIVIVSYFVLNKTLFGLRLKSSGENPYALETSGVSVKKTRYTTLYIAGLLSSLSGVVFITKSTFFFTVNGSGFLAIGILILGQYKVIGTVIGSIVLATFIGFFDTLPLILGVSNQAVNRSTNIMKALPFVIPIIGLIIFKKSFVPKTVGQNFKKDQR